MVRWRWVLSALPDNFPQRPPASTGLRPQARLTQRSARSFHPRPFPSNSGSGRAQPVTIPLTWLDDKGTAQHTPQNREPQPLCTISSQDPKLATGPGPGPGPSLRTKQETLTRSPETTKEETVPALQHLHSTRLNPRPEPEPDLEKRGVLLQNK